MTDSTASFLPNLGFGTKVRVLDADPVFASNDFALRTTSLYRSGIPLLSLLVEPTPFCDKIWGTRKDEDRVLGMLRYRLNISIYTGEKEGWVEAKLQNVLVIDALPVPLHVSLKALDLFPGNLTFNFKASIFPEKFRSHPYWNPDESTTFVGSVASEGIERTLERTKFLKENASGRPNAVIRR